MRKWQRKSLQSAFQIWGCGWGAGLAHPSQNEVYLCAAYAPLMRRSYQIAWAHLWDCPPPLGWWRWTVPFKRSYGGARNCYNHLCAEWDPLIRDSLRINSYSRKLKTNKKVNGALQNLPGWVVCKNDRFYNVFFCCLCAAAVAHKKNRDARSPMVDRVSRQYRSSLG